MGYDTSDDYYDYDDDDGGDYNDDNDDRYNDNNSKNNYIRTSTVNNTLHHHHRHRHHYHYNSDHYANYTITTKVSIRVTPLHNHFISWGILWGFFIIVCIVAIYQIIIEERILKQKRQQQKDIIIGVDEVGVGTNSAVDSVESVSTADVTRSLFRRLLLLANICRIIMIPIQIWSDPMWWQFVGDTLPEMIFASAWTLLVTFFVQLVGVATGTGTNTTPGTVIHAIAYAIYSILILTLLYNSIASILLYALLCCIYATMFGIVIYFCPKLISLLRPSLNPYSGLAIRLTICTVTCVFVFFVHAVDYARLVVVPPRKIYWWWQYGVLELFPSLIFLSMMHPKSKTTLSKDVPADGAAVDETNTTSSNNAPPRGGGGMRQVDSSSMKRVDSTNSAQHRASSSAQETTSLLKGSPNYGGTASTGSGGGDHSSNAGS